MSSTQKILTENSLDLSLQTEWLGQKIIHYSELDSTQTHALEYAQSNCEEGLVILSEKQTAGKGSQSRTWYSNNDHGIWLSFVLYPDLAQRKASQLTLLSATVLTKVISASTHLTPAIKWPNDVLIGNKKVAGILTESKSKSDTIDYAVIGLGLNVNQLADQLSDQIRQTATSLKIETNQSYSKDLIIQAFLNQFEIDYGRYVKNGFDQVRDEWLQSAYRLGDRIRYTVNGEVNEGIFRSISDDGYLIVENEQQKIKRLASAEISWF